MQSLNLNLPDTVYAAITAAAASSGQTAETVAVDQLTVDFTDDVPDSFWTPAILAKIDAAVAEADQGGGISLDEMRGMIAAQDGAWRANHPA